MTAEKGEHERAPRAGESCPTPLRATLRAPPSKWAIKGFFPAGERSEPRSRTARRAPADRSPRRTAGRAASVVAVPLAFFGTFFRFERKYYPPSGRQPHRPRRSRRVDPPDGIFLQHSRLTPLLAEAFHSPLSPSGRPMERQYSTRAGVGASIPRRDFPTAEGFACDKIGAALPAVNSVCRSPSA